MNTIKKNILFTILYVISCIIIMGFTVVDNKDVLLFVKPLVTISLMLYYFLSVKKVNIVYIFMLVSVLIGHVFIINFQKYFLICIYNYLIFHTLATFFAYNKILLKKSIFNVFNFSLPFFMTFTVIFFLIYDNIQDVFIEIFLFGTIVCINGAVVLLNYSQKQDVDNYLIFVGIFAVITADAIAALFKFHFEDILYYQLLVLFDLLGQYAICRGIIIKQQEKEKISDF